MSTNTIAAQPGLAGNLWLAIHDTMAREKAALLPQTRCLALAGALLVELVDLGIVGLRSGDGDTQHRGKAADGNDALSLYIIPVTDRSSGPVAIDGYDSRGHQIVLRPSTAWDVEGRPLDPALGEMYDSILRESAAPIGSESRPQPDDKWSFFTGVGQYRADGWEPQHRPRIPAQRAPSAVENAGRDGRTQRPPVDVPVRVVLEWWAADGRSETLVVDRLLRAGLVRVETQYRVLHGERQVIVPLSSVVSGRPITRITGGLKAARFIPETDLDPRIPRGLTAYDKRLAGLFAAAGLFDLERTRLSDNEMNLLRQQLQADFPSDLAGLLRQVSLAITNLAVIR